MKQEEIAVIPISLLSKPSISPLSKLVFMEMNRLSNEEGAYSGGRDYLSKLFHVDERSIFRCIKELKDCGVCLSSGSDYVVQKVAINNQSPTKEVSASAVYNSKSKIENKANNILDEWNRVYRTNHKISKNLIGLIEARLSSFSEREIIESLRKRRDIVMTDKYWSDPSRSHIRDTPSTLLKSDDEVEKWLGSSSSSSQLTPFQFG